MIPATRTGRRLAVVALMTALAAIPGQALAETDHIETAGLPPPTETIGRFEVPRPLTAEDARRYTRIFDIQESGRWRDADAEIAKLDDRTLMGHVLAQRYLHPTKYRSRYKELYDWLQDYADHPDARRIYLLALKRKPAKAKAPRAPVLPRLMLPSEIEANEPIFAADDAADAPEAGGARNTGAAAKKVRRAPRGSAASHWRAGLAAYRKGQFRRAAERFEAMAAARRISAWSRAAAAFWAARSNLVARRPERVSRWLEIAAEHPRTFYGIIARRMLGLESALTWDHPRLQGGQLAAVMRAGAARRAMALVQAGQSWRAERELRQIATAEDPELQLALIAIADEARLPSLALTTSEALVAAGGDALDRGLYPIPGWEPAGGFTVDRALVYAFMRQESAFNVTATSRAGARGLMQLMPATAGYMAKKRFRGAKRKALYDPELNIELGQRYLRYLIEHEQVQGDVFLLAAAYNGGPGNLAKWQKRMSAICADPLLFIESIPSRETRTFVERVLANLWIYRERLGQENPSLDAIAAGERPVYKALDPSKVVSASDGRN